MSRNYYGLIWTDMVMDTSGVPTEKFDDTKWQRTHFDDMSSDEFNERAVAFAQRNA